MRLVILEYLSMLKESKELDSLLVILLQSMDIEVISKPVIGGRQFGVDVAAVGKDSEDGVKKLFLFVVKQGNINRSNWDNKPQDTRQSIDEILDVYLTSHIEKKYSKLPVSIILCFNGNMEQTVQANWTGFVKKRNSKKRKLTISSWDIDKLSSYIIENLMKEFLFPEEIQKEIRKTLALIDLNEYDLSNFYNIITKILSVSNKTLKNDLKSLRLLNLCINLVYKWAEESGNLKPALIASERLILKVFSWMNKKGYLKDKKILKEFQNIHISYTKISSGYFIKIRNHCYVQDALFSYGGGAEEIEYPLITFEQIGIIATIGLNYLNFYNLTQDKRFLRSAINVSNGLFGLIINNKSSYSALYDGHIIDITLGLLLFYHTKRFKEATHWIEEIFIYLSNSYVLRKRFPILSDSYDELIFIETGYSKCKMESSTLIPISAEWSIILKNHHLYNFIKEQVNANFKDIDMQIWYPEDDVESYLFDDNVLNNCGTMRTSIKFPEKYDDFVLQTKEEIEVEIDYNNLQINKSNYPILGLVASRHYRSQILPYFWRKLISVEK
ncbi:MAG: hypothetical protein WC358_00265 [Ignavibacteria bacterium]|jgi:hypothetical protein